ncbi:MAG: hypothetical protein H5T59_08180 [Anaerolineae bacterium]|nr:hypothetical protein [Anaerolineae bacterium]
MVDWVGALRHAVWVLGLAVLLATWSVASWEARQGGGRTLAVLERPGHVAAASAGLALFALGMALTAGHVWEQTLWGILAAACVAQGAWALHRGARSSHDG